MNFKLDWKEVQVITHHYAGSFEYILNPHDELGTIKTLRLN